MKIRSDLVGVVHVDGVVLAAGDTIPDGAVVGEHLIESEGAEDGTRKRGGRRSSTRPQSDD